MAQVELPLRRPQSPVAQVLHAQIAQMRSDEDAQQVVPAQQSMGDEHRAPAAAAQDDAAEVAAVSDAVVSMVIAEAREELEHRAPAAAAQDDAAEVAAVSDAVVSMVIAEAWEELVQAELSAASDACVRAVMEDVCNDLMQASQPNEGEGASTRATAALGEEERKDGEVERASTLAETAMAEDRHESAVEHGAPGARVEETHIAVKLELTLDMSMADIQGNEQAFSDALAQDIAASIGVESGKVHVLQLQAGSVLATVGLEQNACGERSASIMDIARQLMQQAFDPSSPLRDASVRWHTAKVISARILSDVPPELDATESPVGPASDALVTGVESAEAVSTTNAPNDVEIPAAREVEDETSPADEMPEANTACLETERQPAAQESAAVELAPVEDTIEAAPTSPREAAHAPKAEAPARPVDADTTAWPKDESPLSSLSIQGGTIEDVTGTPARGYADSRPPLPDMEAILEDESGDAEGTVLPTEKEAERVQDEDVARRLFAKPEPEPVADEVAAERVMGGRAAIDEIPPAQMEKGGVDRAGENGRVLHEDERVAGEEVKKKTRKKRRVNLHKRNSSPTPAQRKVAADERERSAMLETQRSVEEQYRRDLEVAAEKERLRERQDKRIRAQLQKDQTLRVKWVMDRDKWESASAARAKSPHVLVHGVEQQRVTYSLGRHREARHRAAIEASTSFEAASPAVSLCTSPTGTPSARISMATPHPKAFPRVAHDDSPPDVRRFAWDEDDDGGESEDVHAAVRPSTAVDGGRAWSPGSGSSRPRSSADMFSAPMHTEESRVIPRRRRQRPQPISTSDALPSHIQLARSPYGSTKPGFDLQRATVTTPPARYAKKVRQAAGASPTSAVGPASVHFSPTGSPGSRMQQLRTMAQSNRERGFETAASGGARRPATAPPNKSRDLSPHSPPSGRANAVGAQSPGPTRQPIDKASADRRRKNLIMGILSESQLFGPMLVGDTCLGRVKLPIATLLMDEDGAGAQGSVEVPVHNSSGRPLLGLDGHLSTVTICWKDSEECLSVIVERASHLPKVKRFGLCDAQVTVECGLYKFSTDVVRCDLNPYFNTVYHFPKPLMLATAGSPASQHLLVSIMHVDVRDLLEDVARECLVVVAEPGASIMRSGEEPERMLVLASGSVSVWSEAKGTGAAEAHAGGRRAASPVTSPHRSPTQTGRGVSPKRRRRGALGKGAGARAPAAEQPKHEVGTISQRGTCFGDLAVLTGQKPRYTLVASSEVWLLQVPREAVSSLLQQHPDVAEHLAHAVCQHRENAFWARRGSTLDVHGA